MKFALTSLWHIYHKILKCQAASYFLGLVVLQAATGLACRCLTLTMLDNCIGVRSLRLNVKGDVV